jgi:DNA polymerase
VKFWNDIQEAFQWTYSTHRDATVGPISFYADVDNITGFDVVMVLPSGRELRYSNVHEVIGEKGVELTMYSARQKKTSKIYGGYLTENIVQGLCRDTLAEAILRLEKQGLRVPLHVHDELVVLAPVDEAETVLDTVVEELSKSPSWAPDLPLDADGWIAPYYGK